MESYVTGKLYFVLTEIELKLFLLNYKLHQELFTDTDGVAHKSTKRLTRVLKNFTVATVSSIYPSIMTQSRWLPIFLQDSPCLVVIAIFFKKYVIQDNVFNHNQSLEVRSFWGSVGSCCRTTSESFTCRFIRSFIS